MLNGKYQFLNYYIVMERLFKVLINPGWKLALEKLETINLTCDDYTDLKDLQNLVKQKVRTSGQLPRYFKAMKKIAITPQTIVKEAIFFHVYLQNAKDIDEAVAIDFMNYLLFQCNAVIQVYSQENSEASSLKDGKNAIARSQASTRQDQIFLSKECFLITKIAKPYLRYVLKIISIFGDLQGLNQREKIQTPFIWSLINLIRCITGFTNHFIMIGRYFMKDYGGLVVVLTQTLTKDLVKYMNCLRKFIRRQNYILSCTTSHTEDNKQEIEEFVSMLNQLTNLNDQLMQIYLGKYFYREFRDIQQPEWIDTSCSQFDAIFKFSKNCLINQQKTKQVTERTASSRSSKNILNNLLSD